MSYKCLLQSACDGGSVNLVRTPIREHNADGGILIVVKLYLLLGGAGI